jgi:hypothetical protein
MMRLPAALFLAFVSVAAAAEPGRKHDGQGREQRPMSQEDRQRMREDMREAYRSRGERPQRQQMSPEQREKLRRDIQDANKDMKR